MNTKKCFSAFVTDFLAIASGLTIACGLTSAPALSKRRLLMLATLVIACASPAFAQGSKDYHKLEVYGGYSFGRFKSNTETNSFVDPSGQKTTFTNLCSKETGDEIGPNFQHYFCERRNFHGFDASVTYNLTRYFGVKFDVTGHFKNEQFVDVFPTPGGNVTFAINTRERIYNFLGGVQVKDNSKETRIKPFGHVLAGAARYRSKIRQTVDVFPDFNFAVEDPVTSFAMKVGGGLDLRISRRIDLRLVEFDYNPIFAGDRKFKTIEGPLSFSSTGKTAHNYTIGVGIVFH
jgi:opacity protein-like surface antigen